jgi:tetratricopeptide (TPR) repeat protein
MIVSQPAEKSKDTVRHFAAPAPGADGSLVLLRLIPHASVAILPRRPQQRVDSMDRSRVFQVDAGFVSGGTWAGVEQLAEAAYLGLLEAGHGSTVDEHLLELHMVLPARRDRIHPTNLCLTDTADDAEKTRYHQLDRAYRIVNGIIGLILQWKRVACDPGRWTVVARNFDGAQHLAARFFTELARRSADDGIEVVVESGRDILHSPQGMQAVPAAPWIAELVRGSAMPRRNSEIETTAPDVLEKTDMMSEHLYLDALIRHRASGDNLNTARAALRLFDVYCHHGYYHEARALMDIFLPFFNQLTAYDEAVRVYYAGRMNICLVMTNDSGGALQLISELVASHLTEPHLLANMNYSIGMHHLRYAHAKDVDRAEQHLQQAAVLARTAAASASRCRDPFQTVFMDNGLAFLRARQGRHQEALDLCRSGYEFLTSQVGEDRHRLHRSVLLYNIAQVAVMLGRIDEAIEYFRKSIDMDPYYSEYHNEIGNLLQEQGRYNEAAAHYARAVGCSAPYAEVYFNKALCHLRLEQMEDALACFQTTLELNPAQPEACALLGDVLRELDRPDEALECYDAAIAVGSDSTAVRVNRAVLHYSNGMYRLALADMDHVIASDPGDPAHYENRAEIHRAMQHQELCVRDLEMADRCREPA